MISHKTFLPEEATPTNVIFPNQTHGIRVVEIISGSEDLSGTDGLVTRDQNFRLAIKTADCAPVVFIGSERFGIAHAGWRGLVDGILEQMLQYFPDEKCQIIIGPLLPEFEIKRDSCYDRIAARFGERFFVYQDDSIRFHFLDAIRSVLPTSEFCGVSTLETPLASWRRDRDLTRGQNITIVGEGIEEKITNANCQISNCRVFQSSI